MISSAVSSAFLVMHQYSVKYKCCDFLTLIRMLLFLFLLELAKLICLVQNQTLQAKGNCTNLTLKIRDSLRQIL